MADQQELSPAAYERLKAELDLLTGEGRIEIANKIETARALGDLSENGDYHAAKEEQGKMEARIRQLEALLEDAEIVEGGETDTVAAGVIVSLRYDGDDESERFLLGSIEEQHDEVEVMSPGSALGQALIGAKVDDVVEYETPTGAVLKVTVTAIEPN